MGNQKSKYYDEEAGDTEGEAFNLRSVPEKEIAEKTPSDFNRRVCVKYVAGDGELCSGCRESKENGRHVTDGDVAEWNVAQCTQAIPTDAYGELKFPSSYSKKAKYIVVDYETPVEDVVNYLYSDVGFGLQKPKMILSVTGGAQQFSIDNDTKTAFKLGLVKAAKTTNAWIITGGTNKGVMRLVGDAVAEDLNAHDLTVLGVATFGIVPFKEELIIKPSEEDESDPEVVLEEVGEAKLKAIRHNEVPYFPQRELPPDKQRLAALNPNHTDFLLVDNGSAGKYGVEIELRTNIETLIRSSENIPMVLIVVEGGVGTLNTILGALKGKTPIILLAKTKGCADLVREVREKTKNSRPESWIKIIESVLSVYKVRREQKTVDNLLEIISDPEYDIYMNVYQMNTEGCGSDIEQSILYALSKAKTNAAQRIELAIRWNRFDIAKEEMRKERNEEIPKLKEDEIFKLLELALLENRYQFVNLLLEREVNLSLFLDVDRLKRLYNNEALQDKAKYEEPFLVYLQKKYERTKITIELKSVRKLYKELFPGSNFRFLPVDYTDSASDSKHVRYPESNLFYWCVLSNRVEIAKIFWRLGKYQISSALIACKLLRYFAKYLPDFSINLKNSAMQFEDLAVGVLRIYDKNTRECVNDVLVIRYIKDLEMDSLELAVHCKCDRFVSNSTVQSILNNIWRGKTNDTSNMTEREKELKRCQASYNRTKQYVFNTDRVSGFNQNATRWQRFKSLFYVPYWHFILNLVFYIMFLLLFSYTLLFEYKYDYPENEAIPLEESFKSNASNGTAIATKGFTKIISKLKITGYEVILLIWILSLLAEEARQILTASHISVKSWGDNFKKYFKEQWNILDVTGCLLFILGFIVKSISLINPEKSVKVFNAARVILSIDVAIWYMRALHFCLVLESLGPKLLMIRKMFDDLKYFLIIIGTFLLAFGVSLQAIIAPADEFSWRIFVDILNIGYWPIYGEISVLGLINNDTCLESGSEEPPCLDSFTYGASYALLMVYMLIASVLLINLLIAMFSSTYEHIQEGSDIIWKNQRYHLICEYVDSPILPPPLNILIYIFNGVKKTIELRNQKPKKEKMDDSEFNILIDYEQKSAQELLNEARITFEDSDYSRNAELEEKLMAHMENKLEEMMASHYKTQKSNE